MNWNLKWTGNIEIGTMLCLVLLDYIEQSRKQKWVDQFDGIDSNAVNSAAMNLHQVRWTFSVKNIL